MSKISDLNLDEIRHKIEVGNFKNALTDLIDLVNEDHYSELPFIFEGILELIEKGMPLNKVQLKIVKEYIDSYDENTQEFAIKIYITLIEKNPSLLEEELFFIISMFKDFEPIIRENFIDLIIRDFDILPSFKSEALSGLIACLKDEVWTIRIKILEFLNQVLQEDKNLLDSFKKPLEVLYDEEDIDVIKEALDFLLRFMMEKYSKEDIKELLISIKNRSWIAQEKILFLIGKLAIVKHDLIDPIKKDFVSLLDYDDYLITTTMVQILKEIIEYQPNYFDCIFFSFINEDKIDNLDAIEEILEFSIIKHGYERFYELFLKLTPLDYQIFIIFNNIIKRLFQNHLNLMKLIFEKLIRKVIPTISQEIFLKLRMILSPNPQYDIYLKCFKILEEIGFLEDIEREQWRFNLITFLRKTMPELGYLDMSIWLNLNIQNSPVPIDELCNRFHIQRSNLIQTLKYVIVKKNLNVKIEDDILHPIKDITDLKEDLIFLKKWVIKRNSKTLETEIILKVKIRNNTDEFIEELSIIIDYPKNLFIEPEEIENKDKDFPKRLKPKREIFLEWTFKKYQQKETIPISSSLKILIIYLKNSKMNSIVKKLDILLL
ncbi:MAG: hypothetical protein ACTSR8_07600 [Promethearchaeota archaeon]